jgi:hypothetical protein
MFKPTVMAGVIALTLTLPAAALAQTNEQLDEIRKQIQDMKDSYDKRIQALEKQLKEAEDGAAKAQSAATQAQSAAGQAKESAEAASQATGLKPPASPSAFNPAMSLILQGGYYNSNQNPATRSVTGFLGPGELGLPPRGFDVGETEITLSANVDHLFYGQATLSIQDGVTNVEEAFFQTIGLGHGLTITGARYFSGVGYWNSFHKHAWDFEDASLVQQAFLGENFKIDGLRASWIAPLPVYLEFGIEGGKPVEFPFPDSDHNSNGFQTGTLFAHVGDDIGVSSSYRFGIWAMQAKNQVTDQSFPALDFTGVTNTLTGGNNKLWGLDFVYKWAPNGDPAYTNAKITAEWMHRSLDGTLTSGANTGPFTSNQSGWYVQGVYQFHPYWRVGLRYDQLNEGSYDLGPGLAGTPGLVPPDFTPKRWTAMIDWSPSEFSRFRLQYNQDKSQQGITDNQVFLQYIFSLGTHGAHKF